MRLLGRNKLFICIGLLTSTISLWVLLLLLLLLLLLVHCFVILRFVSIRARIWNVSEHLSRPILDSCINAVKFFILVFIHNIHNEKRFAIHLISWSSAFRHKRQENVFGDSCRNTFYDTHSSLLASFLQLVHKPPRPSDIIIVLGQASQDPDVSLLCSFYPQHSDPAAQMQPIKDRHQLTSLGPDAVVQYLHAFRLCSLDAGNEIDMTTLAQYLGL